jgi:hypothetical protein
MSKSLPSWLIGTLSKHDQEALSCLRDLLDAAYARGSCTAEDIQHLPAQRNVIGSVFKRLPSCGIKQSERRVRPQKPEKHGRLLWVWEVDSYARVEAVRAAIKAKNKATLLNEPAKEGKQYLLGV